MGDRWRGCVGCSVALVAGLLTTVAAADAADGARRRSDEARIEVAAANLAEQLDDELDRYTDALGAAATFASLAHPVTDADFEVWGDGPVFEHLPVLQAIALVSYVRAADLAAFEAAQRADANPGFAVHSTAVGAADHFVVSASTAGRSELDGVDLGAAAERRAAFEQARDSGEPALTEPFTLVADQDLAPDQRQLGFALYVPVYRPGAEIGTVAERRAAIIGFTASAVRGQDFLTRGSFEEDGVGFELLDAASGASLGASAPDLADATATRTVDAGGQRWSLRAAATPRFRATADGLPVEVLALGTALSVVLAVAVRVALHRRLRLRRRLTHESSRATMAEQRSEEAFARLAEQADAWRLAEARKRRIFDTLREGVVLQDAAGTIVEWNPATEEILGLSADQLAGRSPYDEGWGAIHPDGRDLVSAEHPSVIARETGEPALDHLIGMRRPTGDVAWVVVDATPVLDGDEVAGVVVTFTDVTAKRAAEALRIEAESRFRAAFDEGAIGMALLGDDGRLTAVNRAFAEMLGRSPAQLVGTEPGAFTHPDDLPAAVADTAALWRGDDDGRASIEARFVRADGTVGWARTSLARLPASSGAAVVLQVEDVTDRAEAIAQLRESEATRRASLEALGQGVALFTTDGRVAVLNRAGEEILGLDRHELTERVSTGRWVTYDLDGAVLPPSGRPIRHTLDTGEPVRGQVVGWDRADGGRILLEVSTEPVLDQGVPSGVVIAFADVTEAHAAAAAAREAQEAARRVEARFAALVERSTDIICLLDAEGAVLYASPAGDRLLGYEAAPRTGRSFPDLLHPDDVAPTWRAFRSLAGAPGATTSIQCRLRTRNGGWRHVEVVATNRLDDEAVGGVVANVRDVTERAEAAARLSWQAFHDPLTGLPNRALLLDRLGHALDQARRTGDTTALLFVDLDRFKTVNDTHGHGAGDDLLVEVAARLTGAAREEDTVARLGGDEFIVLTERLADPADASVIAARILAALATPVVLAQGPVQVSASIGIAFDVDHRADTLLRDADNALYRAKASGKNRFEVFDDGLRSEAMRRISTEQLLRRALDDGDGITVHYQPVLDLVTGEVVSAEALLRIPGPDGRLESPAEFIPIAEETGLIVAMGAGVLDHACRTLRSWRDELGDRAPRQVAVNVSARQLASPGFAAVVRSTLRTHGLVPADLVVEFTESTIIGADRSTARTVQQLHDLGATLAVDDFGTGYSSLQYLKRFPVDVVKLDRGFVDGLGIDANDTEIVRAVLSLGRSLGMVTIAEGIETPEQLAALRALGCDLGQGFLLATPQPADALPGLVAAGATPR